MSTQVTVLCPNGRRQQVKTTPITKVLEIVDEVCKKQGYVTNEYDLIHQRRALDVTLTLRLAGVPNNGQLELKKCENGPRKFDDVTIALQLEDGSRLPPNTFNPESTSLRTMLEASQKDFGDLSKILTQESDTGVYPVVAYLNEQVVGVYQLANTTLKDLGLTNGRVIVRFSTKPLDKETMDQMNQEFRQKLEKKAKLDAVFQQKQQQELEDQKRQALIPKVEPEPQPSTSQQSFVNQDYGVTRKPRQELDFVPPAEPRSNQGRRAVNNESQFGEAPLSSYNPPNEFANFKFPEHTKGQKLNDHNELAEIEKLSKEPCDRQAIIFNSERSKTNESQGEPMSTDLPDEFFEVNVNDLHNMLSDLKRAQNDDAPLMTKKLRELEQDKKAMKYSQVAVRVSFKGGLILQGLFRPKEKISALYDFVKEALSTDSSLNNSDDLDFHLYITPPKKVLSDMKRTLFDEHLYPAAIVYFKNQSDRTPAFKDPSIRSVEEADDLVYKFVHSAMRNVESDGMDHLIRQERAISNVMQSSGLVGAGPSSRPQHMPPAQQASSQASAGSDVNKKLSKFLGKK